MFRFADWSVDENCEPRDWKDEDPDRDPETTALPVLTSESSCSCEEKDSKPDSFTSKDSPEDVVAPEDLKEESDSPMLNLWVFEGTGALGSTGFFLLAGRWPMWLLRL